MRRSVQRGRNSAEESKVSERSGKPSEAGSRAKREAERSEAPFFVGFSVFHISKNFKNNKMNN